MIVETGKGMSVFTALLIFFSTIFTFINMAIGVDKPGIDEFKDEDEFPLRYDIERHIMQGLSNSFGDLSYPGFEKWEDLHDKYPFSSSSMIILGFSLYYFHIIFMLVLNLNLLIAIISEIFDMVRSS